ncbi:ABC transporter permease [Shinella sp. NM-101]|uniref:ABC transporter permease n=1 Tax=Shinella sp. NM-101 TaxID=2744455 RepID=UPI001F40929A|nr:ABC transporter permease [Shinella sp. NM-101]
MARYRKTFFLMPLIGFLLIFFVVPMVWFLSYAVRETEVPRALPRTLEALSHWQQDQPVPETAFAALAGDMIEAANSGSMADAARRLNYELTGVRSALSKASRVVRRAGAGTDFDIDFFNTIDPVLTSPAFFAVVKRAGNAMSDHYLLAAVDLQRTPAGAVVRAPQENRLYLTVLWRTLEIACMVTLACLFLGFPVAVLLTTSSEKVADTILVLVMLPFWTSLLVRTTAWIVLLQKEGIINGVLLSLGLIAEPLTMIFNRTGVVIAMTHVLLPFMILPLYGTLKAIPRGYMRAAASLGARPFTAFHRVYLPLAAPGIAAGCIMVFILSVGYYVTPALVGGPSDQMLSAFVANYTTGTGNWGLASALGLILLIVTIILYLLAQRLSGGRAISLG